MPSSKVRVRILSLWAATALTSAAVAYGQPGGPLDHGQHAVAQVCAHDGIDLPVAHLAAALDRSGSLADVALAGSTPRESTLLRQSRHNASAMLRAPA